MEHSRKRRTRGDGADGTDWTSKAKYINIQQTVPTLKPLDVRGEVTLVGDSYITLGYKSKRTGTAGIMNKLEVEPNKLSYIKAITYEILSDNLDIRSQFHQLIDMGFKTPFYFINTPSPNLHEEIKTYYTNRKLTAEYDIDGVVLSSSDYKPEDIFLPKRKVAFKINSCGVPTTIIGIEENISKGGLNKPTLLVEPVTIDGSTISRVTGNNWKYLIDNGQGVGAEVLIAKKGEVIPGIVSVTKPVTPILPTHCPSCNTKLEWSGVDLKCNNKDCSHMLIKTVTSFIVKCGVENASETSLTNWGIETFEDLISFKANIGSKSEMNFMEELNNKVFSKTKEELFSCMSFNGAGSTNINKLIEYFGNGSVVATTKSLFVYKNITDFPEGIGQKVVDKIEEDWMRNLLYLKLIITDSRYNPKVVVKSVSTNPNFDGKSFLLTGAISEKRSVVENKIKELGGTIASSVSKNLDYLICGPDSWGSSSKYLKAEKLNVKIITEENYKELI